MYKKIESLNTIKKLGLNIHPFHIPDSFDEFQHTLKKLKLCTIRTDHKDKEGDLPFFIFDETKDNGDKANEIWDISQDGGYKLIISDGIKYDNIQEYNMVVKFDASGDFIFDASELKIPLRHMYRYPLLSCSGNIGDNIRDWNVISQKYGLDKKIIKNDLEILYHHQLFDKWLEVTKYPVPVGTQASNIVFWEIR